MSRSVLEFGSLVANSSEGPERNHIEMVKEAFKRTNRIHAQDQMLAIDIRSFRMAEFLTHLEVRGEPSFDDLHNLMKSGPDPQKKLSRVKQLDHDLATKKATYPTASLACDPGKISRYAFHAADTLANMSFTVAGPRRPAVDVAESENLPLLPLCLARYAHGIFKPHDRKVPKISIKRQKIANAFNLSIFRSMTVHVLPPDPTRDPFSSNIPLKSIIRANPAWKYADQENGNALLPAPPSSTVAPRFDHVIYQARDAPDPAGFGVARVRLFFRVVIEGTSVDLAYIEPYDETRIDKLTGLHIFRHHYMDVNATRTRAAKVIQIKSIYSAAHLMPVFPVRHDNELLDPANDIATWNRWEVSDRCHEFVLNTHIDIGIWDLMNPANYEEE